MKGLNQFLNTDVEVVISGDTRFVGTLIDIGQDIFVIFDGTQLSLYSLVASSSNKQGENNDQY